MGRVTIVLLVLAVVLMVATVPVWGYLQRTEPSDGRSMTRGRKAAAVFLFLAPVTSAFLAVAAIL